MCSPSQAPLPTSLSTRSLWVFPVHQVRALVSCIQPGLVLNHSLILLFLTASTPGQSASIDAFSSFSEIMSISHWFT